MDATVDTGDRHCANHARRRHRPSLIRRPAGSASSAWRPRSERDRVLGFLAETELIPPPEWVAVFDNDGTLWCERPRYPQVHFFVRRLRAAVATRPELAARSECRVVLEGDRTAMDEVDIAREAQRSGIPEGNVRVAFKTHRASTSRPTETPSIYDLSPTCFLRCCGQQLEVQEDGKRMSGKSSLIACLWLVVALAACRSGGEAEPPDLGEGPAFVEDVLVQERNGEYWAIVSGFYPDSCSIYGGSRQEVDGNTIALTVTSTRPEDVSCAQALTDMTEEILLETDGLPPGEYDVVVNDGRSTSFMIS